MSSRSPRILLAGATLVPGWQGGDGVAADLLERGLRKLGVQVLREGSRRSVGDYIRLAISPFDAEATRVGQYRRRLRQLRPSAVVMFFDYDCSWVLAARKEGIPVACSIQLYWPTCPVGTRYIEGQGVCTTPGFAKCVHHMARAPVSPNLGLPMPTLSPPFGATLYSKLRLRPWALSQADALVAVSQFEARILREAGYTRVRVVPNAVDTELFHPAPRANHSKVVLFPVARTGQERKGHSHFIRMAEALHTEFPDVRFRILTDPGTGFIEGTPYLSREALAKEMRECYLAVVPGLWDEPFGLVIAEVMASGRPVVAYDGGGSAELVESGVSGILVPRGKVDLLEKAVRDLLTDDKHANRLGVAARERAVARYRYEVIGQQYLDLLQDLGVQGRSAGS